MSLAPRRLLPARLLGRGQAILKLVAQPPDLRLQSKRLGVAPGARGHGFLNRATYPGALPILAKVMGMHAGYDRQVSTDAWARIDTFFGRHLRGHEGIAPPG